MKRNYQFKSGKTGKSQNKGQVLLVLMAFATGYLSSTIMSMSELESLLNNSLSYFSWYSVPKNPIIQAKDEMPERTPKLEFYTVLTKADEHVLPPQTEKKLASASVEQNKKIAQAEQALELANQLSKDKLLPPVEVAQASQSNQLKSAAPIKNAYVVQLASFRYYSQAEKFKAKLTLKGFDVKISAIRQGTMQWYRVMLGPYASLSEAQKAKLIFQAKEHAPGMVRQMDA